MPHKRTRNDRRARTALVAAERAPSLEAVAEEFDALYAAMQSSGARERRHRALHATPEELGAAAVAGARAEADAQAGSPAVEQTPE